MSNKPKKEKTNITKISAQPRHEPDSDQPKEEKPITKPAEAAISVEKPEASAEEHSEAPADDTATFGSDESSNAGSEAKSEKVKDTEEAEKGQKAKNDKKAEDTAKAEGIQKVEDGKAVEDTTKTQTAESPEQTKTPESKSDTKTTVKTIAVTDADEATPEKPLKKVFILARPFVALGRYLRDSWRELRQVRWPGRKTTWKMTLAVIVYCVLFVIFIVLLDMFFTFIFNLILN